MTGKELSEVVAEAAARTLRAAALQQEAIARQEAVTAEIEKLRPRWEEERVEFREGFVESRRKTDAILAELKEHRAERRALLEAIFRVIDRLDQQQPPPPPHLRSV